MAISRNKLLQMQMVIDLYLAHKTPDNSNRWVLKNVINKVYPMSERTLYRYLETPVKKLMKALDSRPADNNQLSLF